MAVIKKIGLYFVILCSLAFLLRFVLHNGMRANQYGLFDKLNTIFHSTVSHELIFFGSSRAECHFNPRIFDSITGINSYNIGITGSNNSFTYGILKSYLSCRETPKMAIMNIDYHFANQGSDTIFEFPRYFPYLDNEVLFHELVTRDKRFYAFKYIPFYSLPFLGDKYLNSAIRGYSGSKSTYDASCYKGFLYINPIEYRKLDVTDTISYNAVLLKENVDYLDSIVNLCKQKQIKLYFVVTPAFSIAISRIKNFDEHIGKFRKVAEENSIPFFNYSNDTICKQESLFAYDPYHMKKEGADLFTKKFSKEFKSLLDKK